MRLRKISVQAYPALAQVPKVIHQTFRSRPGQVELADSIEAIRAANSGWEYRFYSDDQVRDYLLTHYGSGFIAHFDALNPHYPAARADLFRYALLYREGGAYFDIKSRPTRPLDEVVRPEDSYLLSHWPSDGPYGGWGNDPDLRRVGLREYQQWFIVAAPGHPYLKAVIDCVLKRIRGYHPIKHGIGKMAVLRVTGPYVYTEAIAKIRDRHPHRLVDSRDDLGFDYSIYPGETHRTALGPHYSTVREPLVLGRFGAVAAVRLRARLRALMNGSAEY